eukprot:COSAG06_NODE_4313_length_4371_cov_3.708333_4_plen_94_part_00
MLVARNKRDCLQRAMTSHYRHIVCVHRGGSRRHNAIVLDFVTTPASLAMVPSVAAMVPPPLLLLATKAAAVWSESHPSTRLSRHSDCRPLPLR